MATIPANNVMVLHSQDPTLVSSTEHYHRQSVLDTTSPLAVFYEFRPGTTWISNTNENCHGIEARWNSTTQETEFYVNSTKNTGTTNTCRPDAISLVPSGGTASFPGAGAYVSAASNDIGKDLVFWTASNSSICLRHTLVAGSLFTSSGGGGSGGSGSGGSGSGANTLSGGSGAEIKDVTFTKATDTIVYLAFNWQNVSTAYLFVDSGGTVTQTNISLGGLGQSGSVGSSGYLTNMQDGDKVWIANTDTVDDPYIHRYIEWSYDKTTGKVSAKAFFKDLGGNGFNQNADMALARIFGATYNHGYSLAEAQADPTGGHVNHDGTLQTMSLDAEPGTKWAVSQLNTLQYGSAFAVPKKSTKVSSNFW